jgi:hypothetical protein
MSPANPQSSELQGVVVTRVEKKEDFYSRWRAVSNEELEELSISKVEHVKREQEKAIKKAMDISSIIN